MTTLSKKTKQKIIDLCKENLTESELLDKINEEVYKGNPMNRTITIRFSAIKAIVSKFYNDEVLLSKIRPPTLLTNEVIKENKKVRDEKKRYTINEDIFNKFKSLKDSTDVYDLAIYLLLMTGRRISELLTAKFYTKKNNPNIFINGIKKKRTDNIIDCEFTPLISKTRVIKKIKEFKKKSKNINKDTFKRTLLRKIKKKISESVHTHMLRGFYVTYLYKFRNNTNDKINTFIMNKLCHDTVDSSFNYTGYNIVFNEDIISKNKL
jgi:integrase